MSALAGVWRLDGAPGADADCARMLAALAPYGPHADAWRNEAEIALGRRLFRVLPEDRHDTGPVALPRGGWLVADVRLDNRPELEGDLMIAPGQAPLMADPALLAAAWTRWGEGCLERLVGDYAVAVWDAGRRRLLLARDPFGHRPLNYHRGRGFFAFASMPVGLHVLTGTPPTPDEASLAAFLALRPEEGSATFFGGVERVEAGGLVIVDRSGVAAHRHYAPAIRPLRLATSGDYAEALREHLDQAVAAQLRGAERGVGAHLSSGWDSGAVAATAARLLAPQGGRVAAFTAAPRAGYAGPAPRGRHGDESPGAQAVAALYPNMDHVVVRGDARSPLADLDRDIALSGRPALNPCNHLWVNDLNATARARGLNVMLTGDFGNLGLSDDGQDALPELFLSGDWLRWWRLVRAVVGAGALSSAGALAASLEPAAPSFVATLRRLAGRPRSRPGAHSALPPGHWPRPTIGASARPVGRTARRLAALIRLDPAAYGKAALAAYQIDMRDPLTDRRLVEFCLSIPVDRLIAGGRLRGLARLALADRLPASTLESATRGYQAVDWHEGLSSDRAAVEGDLERLARVPAGARLLDLERLRVLTARWPTGDWHRDEAIEDYRMALLRGLAAGRFLTRTLGVNG
jgi:asparagine synthase (glutamine-hydrolysing)